MATRLLIVDDLELHRNLIRNLIGKRFPETVIEEAQSGAAALERIRTACPDIVILDVKMPDMDGFEVCRRIKNDPNTSSVLVLMISGYLTDAGSRASGLQCGADSYLCKPFENEELLAQFVALERIHRTGETLVQEQKRLENELENRKSIEKQLKTAKNTAEAAVRAKDVFLAHMSHEIRTPMNAVIGMTEIMLDSPLPAELQEYVRTINTAGETLLTVINDILDHAKIETGKLSLEQRPFQLVKLVRETVNMVRSQAESKGLRLDVHIAPGTPCNVTGDTIRMRQILLNLLSNAVKFTEHGGITVNVSSCRLDHDMCEVNIKVRDTGVGIPADKQKRLFAAFSQADDSTTRRYGGTGLGLVISKNLAELMGGDIRLESVEGRGSLFHARVKLSCEKSSRKSTAKSGRENILAGRIIMLLDDNDVNRRIIVRQTSSWGMQTIESSSPQDALERLAKKPRPELVIVDMCMPKLDGIGFAREVRAMDAVKDIPLVLLSSTDLTLAEPAIAEAEAKVRQLFAARLHKPVEGRALFDVLSSLLMHGKTAADEQQPLIPSGLEKLRVLVAEDNPVNQKVAGYLLQRLGSSCDFAEDGRAAVAAARETNYDLILMDVQMPHMDGLEAMQAIRNERAKGHMPYFVALTAHAMQGDREKCLNAGMDDYISKPILLKELLRVLDQCAKREKTA